MANGLAGAARYEYEMIFRDLPPSREPPRVIALRRMPVYDSAANDKGAVNATAGSGLVGPPAIIV